MKSLIIAAALFSNFCWAGPIIVGSGAGESEYALLFAQAQLPDLLSACSLNRCTLTPAEAAALVQIQSASAHPPQAIFKTDSEMSGSILRVIGAQVWFNEDELWLDPSNTIAYDVPHAAGLWVQVLGQNLDQQVINSLRLKIQSALNLNLGENSTLFGSGSLAVVFWSHSVYLRDGQANVLPLTAQLVSQITAMDQNTLQFFSARWTNVNRTSGAVRLDLNLMWTAQGNPMRGVGTITMQVSQDGVIDAKSVRAIVQEE
jgi:hypothetical protein